MDRLSFERPVVTPPSVRAAVTGISRNGRVALHGLPGSGRSWVARRVAEEVAPKQVLFLRFGNRVDRTASVLAQASQQLGTSAILRSFVEEGLEAGLQDLSKATSGWVVVADDADPLMPPSDDSWVDADGAGLLEHADASWTRWLSARDGATIVVSRRPLAREGWNVVGHAVPSDWPIKLRDAEGGFRDWPRLARILGERPDRLFFAAAVVPLLSARTFSALLDDESSALTELGNLFRAAAPRRAAALDLVTILDGAPDDVVKDALASMSEDPLALFDSLRDANLLTMVAGRVEVSAAVRESGAARPIEPRHAARLAVSLLSAVNDAESLTSQDAGRILAVHRLAVHANDLDLALRTCRLHVQGLIELARRESKAGRYEDAAASYARIRSMLDASRASQPDLRRVRSYVLHYHAWNGVRGDCIPLPQALAESAEAVGLWPENARWHGLQIELLIAQSRTVEAVQALALGESQVAWHPQRARHLRVRPARRALDFGLVRLCLELVEDGDPDWLNDSEAVDVHRGIRAKLRDGVDVTQLDNERGFSVVFLRSVPLRLVRLTASWEAGIRGLATVSDRGALGAFDALVARIAEDARSLITTPTPRLEPADAVRKGLLLSVVDALNSDIGIHHRAERYVLGRVEDSRFLPVQRADLAELELPPDLYGERPGLWFARVPVGRDGQPVGRVAELVPAGSGRSADALRKALDDLRQTH